MYIVLFFMKGGLNLLNEKDKLKVLDRTKCLAPTVVQGLASNLIQENTMEAIELILLNILALCSIQIAQEMSMTRDTMAFLLPWWAWTT
jgi:hypothetical protein